MDRGRSGLSRRTTRLADESYLDFVQTLKAKIVKEMYPIVWRVGDSWVAQSLGRTDGELPLGEIQAALRQLPVVPTVQRLWRTSQEMMWRRTRASLMLREPEWLAAMSEAERRGPGRLIADPGFVVPDYARCEIHLQPGGYTEDPIGGPVFHYGTRIFYLGDNDQNEMHVEVADAASVPADGAMGRILDLGCSIGQATTALAQRFPQAEVWGLDVALPLLRYAHWSAVERGIAVNFVQGLAEQMDFPDGHFDAVVAYILFHEVPWSITERIVPEVARILRKGGTFTIFEFPNRGPTLTPVSRFIVDYDSNDNCEPYSQQFVQGDFRGLLERSGFSVREGKKLSSNSFLQSLVAVRQ
jgi:ubiquinone/menaquinone biosynthesis C-methylase UbiE